MAPPPLVAPPPKEDKKKTQGAPLGRSQPVPDEASKIAQARQHELFAEALLEMSGTRPKRRTLDLVISLLIHFVILTTAILVPLFFTEAIDMKQFSQTLLVAPPPPPPPPPPAAPAVVRVSAPKRVFTSSGKLMAPTVIPEKVAMLKEEELPPDAGISAGVVGGVPGGVPGGQMGGVIGGIIGGVAGSNLPPPPKPAPTAPVRVGGRVSAPRALSTPQPVYPVLARSAKIQGDVVIDAVIDKEGNVVQMSAVSGHPLLIPAAMDALRKWKYQPTLLNDEPVSVALYVTIQFRMQ